MPLTITKGKQQRPRRITIYGIHGVGKSTFGAQAERPIFIPTEEGLNDIDGEFYPLARRYADVLAAIGDLYTQPRDYRTVVIDTLDWLEKLIFAEVCEKNGVTDVSEIDYGKGYGQALSYWREVIDGLDALREKCGLTIILIAHSQIVRFDNPETDSYDRYAPALHKLASAMIQEWCDEVLFATYEVRTKKVADNFGKPVHQGIGDGTRILRTTERPAHYAKNRLGLPDTIPLDWNVFAAYMRGEVPPTAPQAAVEPSVAQETAPTEAPAAS